MNVFSHFRDEIAALVDRLAASGALPSGLDTARVTVEPPRDPAHGDLATNAAMVLAKGAGKPPRAIAEALVAELGKHAAIEAAEIAGPGFINLRVRADFWRARLLDVLKAGLAYGDSDLGEGEPINVEYVSTNPTGLLHVGHARGSVFGDALASVLAKAGYKVTREYYVNDAGKQVEALRDSFIGRLKQQCGEPIPDSAFGSTFQYPGEEIADAARAAFAADAERWRGIALAAPPSAAELDDAQRFAVAYMMDRIREDLAALGVRHDVFTSERHDLVEKGKVDAALETLKKLGHIYTGVLEAPKGKTPEDWEPRAQTLFRASVFGDDTDRPLKKSDGAWTYFASDIAYHLDKFRRGFRTMIDVWGADHGGYVKRVAAAVKAVTDGQGVLDVKICQLVKFLERGEPVRMSKRAGNVITVRDMVERVGKDVMRLIMLTRKNDAPFDFDLAKVQEQSKDNPVFYIQYAHARCCSVFRQAKEAFPGIDTKDSRLMGISLNLLTDSGELGLIKALAAWPRTVEAAAEAHEPHRLAFYLNDVAAAFHGHWNRGKDEPGLRFIVEGNEPLTLARLALVRGVQLVIASGLHVIGVTPVEEMR
jgi:arginyl-tRNA synthetase